MNTGAVEILNKGMRCLIEKLGIVEAEQFISVIIREKFDYTKWQQSYFDGMTPKQIDQAAEVYVAEHPFEGTAKVVL